MQPRASQLTCTQSRGGLQQRRRRSRSEEARDSFFFPRHLGGAYGGKKKRSARLSSVWEASTVVVFLSAYLLRQFAAAATRWCAVVAVPICRRFGSAAWLVRTSRFPMAFSPFAHRPAASSPPRCVPPARFARPPPPPNVFISGGFTFFFFCKSQGDLATRLDFLKPNDFFFFFLAK